MVIRANSYELDKTMQHDILSGNQSTGECGVFPGVVTHS